MLCVACLTLSSASLFILVTYTFDVKVTVVFLKSTIYPNVMPLSSL